jgi:poly [ADP-ribose] polymerase
MKIDSNIPDELKHLNLQVYENSYSATLSLNNILKKNNKFFIIQLLENIIDNKPYNYFIFYRYGRIGQIGEIDIDCYMDLNNALQTFLNTFLEKTGFIWEDRYKDLDIKYKDKYIFTEIKTIEDNVNTSDKSESLITLHISLINLLTVIYDYKLYSEFITQYDLDEKRMPFGSLSKNQIDKAFKVLNKISDILKSTEEIADKKTLLIDLTSNFYSIIPTYLKSGKIQEINTIEMLDKKIDLLNVLLDSDVLYKNITDDNLNKYKNLNCNINVIEPADPTFILINNYLTSNKGSSHNVNLKLISLYECESTRISEKTFKPTKNTYLLWHGSRTINIVSILINGLLINPNNVIINGKMFGNGIYFANCSTKSAAYSSYDNAGYGILLLCEVNLDGMVQYINSYKNVPANTGINAIHGVGYYTPNPAKFVKLNDCIVPSGELIPSNIANTYLHYDEFIVYDQSRVKIKYILLVKQI